MEGCSPKKEKERVPILYSKKKRENCYSASPLEFPGGKKGKESYILMKRDGHA